MAQPGRVFEGVYFAVVPGTAIPKPEEDTVIQHLEANGATKCELSSTNLQNITHLIANSCDFPAYDDAVDAFIHVVKTSWVSQAILKNKAPNPRQFRPDPSFFLIDVVVTVAEDIPEGDKDAIIGGLLALGGQYSPALTRLTTHLIALSMDNAQCRIITSKDLKTIPVLPHWFNDCLKLGKRIDCGPYTLPSPTYFNTQGIDRDLNDKSKTLNAQEALRGASQPSPPSLLPISPSKQRRELDVFKYQAIMLGDDLNIDAHLRRSLDDLIRRSGGVTVRYVCQANVLICRKRSGAAFVEALESGIDIGNLAWLYHLINTNRWISPMRRLLHFPVPRKPLRGFDKFKIAVSNYTGEARVYLESLVKACGGEFTKTLTQDNTHLVTAHTMSEKVDAAREWNIITINHLWLEQTYAKMLVQSVTNPQYTTFPSRTNLGQVVGQTSIDRKQLERTYLPDDRSSTPLMGQKEGSVLAPQSGNRKTPPAKPGKSPSTTERLDLGIPIDTPHSRRAKDRAVNKLHAMAPDIALYQKEARRHGGVVYGGRRKNDPDRVGSNPKPYSRKRSSSGADDMDMDNGDDADIVAVREAELPQRKKQMTVKRRYMVTKGHDFDWTRDKAARMAKLGFEEIKDEQDVQYRLDILVSPQCLRTPKFFAGVALSEAIVKPSWLIQSIKENKEADLAEHKLVDTAFEKRVGFKLSEAMSRAHGHREDGGLWAGETIYRTENVPNAAHMERIVAWNGGTLLLYKGRETTIPVSRQKQILMDTSKNEHAPEVFLISAEDDKHLWGKFKTTALASGWTPQIVSNDWLLHVAMVQHFDDRSKGSFLLSDG